jgi:FkbM family methyltransferase
MNERYSGPLAWLRSWNRQRIEKRRWLRGQWESRTSDPFHSMPVPTKRSCLARLQQAGLVIDTVVDVGVHEEGTPELISAFPRARHLLFEPLASMNPCIEKAYAGFQHELYNVACFSDDGQSYLVGTCIDGSGRVTHTHLADTPATPGIGEVVNCQPIQRVRLDSINLKLGAHVLLKVDVDGVDLEVLKGATELLVRTEVVVVEAPLSNLLERCDFLVAHGFQFYDIVDLCYYHSILSQVDVVFVKADVLKRHPELEPWANKVFSWDGYQQLSKLLDA